MRKFWGMVFGLSVFFAIAGEPVAEEATQSEDRPGTILGWPTEFEGRYPVGTPPGDGWNYVSGDGKVFSSPCIGKPRSPQCLVDTMMACKAWTDMDAGWPTETDAEELLNHPICKALMNHPIVPGRGLRVFNDGGFDPDNWMIYYKVDQRIVDEAMLQSEGAPWFHIRPEDCEICLGDTVVIPLVILCFPDPALAGEERGEWAYPSYDYPPGSPYTYCLDWTTELEALFTRHNPARNEWYVGNLFNPADHGSMGKPWPLVEQWIRRFHAESLPGSCTPRIRGQENC